MRILLLGIVFFYAAGNLEAREIEVINFEEFEEILNSKEDLTYIVNFWATWCAPCVKELPYFEEVASNEDEMNRKVILVSLDFVEHLEKKLIPFVDSRDLKSEVILLDAPNFNDWIPKVSKAWSGAIPATIIYNNSLSKWKFFGHSFEKGELQEEIEKFEK